MSAQVNGARTPRQQTNSATTNMNVLFDLLSGEKEMAPGGRDRDGETGRVAGAMGVGERDGMRPGRVLTTIAKLSFPVIPRQTYPAFCSPLCSLLLLSKIPKFLFRLANFTKNIHFAVVFLLCLYYIL